MDRPDLHDARAIEVDPITALGTMLSRPDGRVATLADRAGRGPLLALVVDRDCATSRGAVAAVAASGARLTVVSQGRTEAAADLVRTARLDERDVLVEPAPHPVSRALAATTVPTLVLVDGGEVVAWQDGWDAEVTAPLVRRAGGTLDGDGGLGAHREGSPSRLTLDEAALAEREAADAGLGPPGR